MRLHAALLGLVLMASPAAAREPVRLYAAGSLRAVLEDVAKQFTEESGIKVAGTYSASGLLRDRIDKGGKAELFASANREQSADAGTEPTFGPLRLMSAYSGLADAIADGSPTTSQPLLAPNEPAVTLTNVCSCNVSGLNRRRIRAAAFDPGCVKTRDAVVSA